MGGGQHCRPILNILFQVSMALCRSIRRRAVPGLRGWRGSGVKGGATATENRSEKLLLPERSPSDQ